MELTVKKKIIYIIHDFKIGGVETAILSGIEEFVKEFDFILICLGEVDHSVIYDLSEVAKSRIIECKLNNKKVFNSLYKILQIVFKFKPEYIISSLWKSHYVVLLLKLVYFKFKHIPFIHSTKSFHFLDSISRFLIRFSGNVIFADSVATSNSLSTKLDIKVVSFIRGKLVAKDKLFLFKKKQYKFLFIGRVTSVKRFDLMFKFIEKLLEQGIYATLDIYGPDYEGLWESYHVQLKKISLANQINYLGVISPYKVFELYQNYDCYVQLSEWEGMSISVVEAMMSGLVCFVTPVGEIKYYSKDNYSAIHLSGMSSDDWNDFIKKSLNVLESEELFKSIANNAAVNWENTITYKDSFIKAIHELD